MPISRALLEQVKKLIPPLDGSLHKGQSGQCIPTINLPTGTIKINGRRLGRVGVLGGALDYTGAPFFASMSALRVGADLSHVICSPTAAGAIKSYAPDLIVHPILDPDTPPEKVKPDLESLLSRLHAIIVGPGLGREDYMQTYAKLAISIAKERGMFVVIDADALFLVGKDTSIIKGYRRAVLTPNVVEFKRLSEQVGVNPNTPVQHRASEVSRKLGGITVLQKGPTDIISTDSTGEAADLTVSHLEGADAQFEQAKETVEVDVPGGLKRCGGQGDVLSGAVGTFMAWGKCYEDGAFGDRKVPASRIPLLASIGGSILTRTVSRMAFLERGRSVITEDMIPKLGQAFEEVYGDNHKEGKLDLSYCIMPPQWEVLSSQKRKALQDSIPQDWIIPYIPIKDQPNVLDVPEKSGLLTPRELQITNTEDVEVILGKLRTAEWTSEETTRAFYKRAIVAHQLTNCLTEIFVERALERARHLDEILAKTGKVVGPLHGLPVSLKDQFTMKGLETVMGYVAGIGEFAEKDSVIVEILYQCGAVPFVRTNVPQTLMWGETYNHVYGRTLNPYNRSLTPGGSSGGEGALLAMKGSPLGIGTDIGGSLRIPSVFCGLYTLRPSYARLPYYGSKNTMMGQESITSVLGPMTNSLSGIQAFMKAVLDTRPWDMDPMVVRKPWDEEEWNLCEHGGVGAQLCFAVMWDNGVVRPHPPLIRAMKIVKAALEKAGHKVIDWECHRHLEIYKNAESIFAADGNHDYKAECAKSGEPLIKSMVPSHDEEVAAGYEYEPPMSMVKTFLGDPPEHVSAYELFKLHEEKRELRKSHLDHWQKTVSRTGTGRPVDAIISPAVAYTAVPHGLNTDSFYTTLCNAMDYTTSAFPVTFVDPTLDVPHEPHEFYNHEDKAIYELYESHLFDGCPVGLQLIGMTLEEEAILRMTYIVDEALQQWKAKEQ
ncbi:hypothetical protein CVT26_008288 [Gymnopilus dilepis]|uniref:ATP-dependent (S)-NAD(P)H-hydrate dehydratase n=1 Tax=Gymnopilus dilepis TaxID=231916 RepID=A0A409WCN0_9AGAR|nr:hypothetical protein CVT26_008288 [Gymnopilus dilepis]